MIRVPSASCATVSGVPGGGWRFVMRPDRARYGPAHGHLLVDGQNRGMGEIERSQGLLTNAVASSKTFASNLPVGQVASDRGRSAYLR